MIRSIAYYRRRASARIVGDLPADLAAMERDQPLVVFARVREVLAREQVYEAGKPIPARRARFGVPSAPTSSRQTSAAGEQSFHFAINRTVGRTARAFDRYSTEDRAARSEIVAVDVRLEDAARSASVFDAYALDHGGGEQTTPLIVTTLDTDPIIRPQQWDAIEAHELAKRRDVQAGVSRINLRYELAPGLLLDIARRNDCPQGLRNVILSERDRVAAGKTLPKRLQRDGVPWIDPGAEAAMATITTMPGYAEWTGRRRRPAKLSRGRAAQPTLQGELEFPHELDRDARQRVLIGLNAFVQRQRPADDGDAVLPFLGVIHGPDALNDDRNDHAHFIIGKSLVTMGEGGSVMIADTTVRAMTGHDIVKRLRCEAASLINVELASVGAERRFNPETFVAMGIDATPQVKLDKDRTVLERAGVPTDAGIGNAIEGWRRAFADAQAAYDDGLLRITERHRPLAKGIAGVADDTRRRQLEADRARLRDDEWKALGLRHQAAEIALLAAMAKSRAALVGDYADGYAVEARRRSTRGAYLASLWSARSQAASNYLVELGRDLGEERTAIAERTVEADRLEAKAATRRASIEAALAAPGIAVETPARTPPIAAHRAVDIIVKAPLLVTQDGGRYVVRAGDDRDGLVRGVDLSGASKRLAGVHRAQQHELARVAAYMDRHGPAACTADALADADRWVRDTIDKWRPTPAFTRMVGTWHAKRAVGGPAWRALFETEDDDDFRDGLPAELPGRPRSLADLRDAERAAMGEMIFARPVDTDPVGVADAPVAPAASVAAPIAREPVGIERPAVAPSDAEADRIATAPSPAPAMMTEADRTHAALEHRVRIADANRRRLGRAERDVERALAAALVERAGDERSLTPHAARLLRSIADGFDPAKVDARVAWTGETLAQRDAVEIAVLSYQPLFATRVEAASRRDPQLLAMIDRTLAASPADPTGRVTVVGGRVRYDVFGDGAIETRATPLELARRSLRDGEAGLGRIARVGGIVGAWDGASLQRLHYNYIGMLHPEIQARLEAIRRIQDEEDTDFVHRVRTRTIRIDPTIAEDPLSRRITTSVAVIGANDADRRVLGRRRGDADFYFACKAAREEGPGSPPLRHPSPIVRALLAAADEPAAAAVVAVLSERARTIVVHPDELASADAAAFARLMQPVAPVRSSTRTRTGRGPPLTPGRSR